MSSSVNIVRFPKTRSQQRDGAFYTPSQAARLARVPRQRVDAWRREGIIPKTVLAVELDGIEEEGYSFESVVFLRVLRMLRDYVPLEKAVLAIQRLVDRFGPPGPAWADARIFRGGRDVFVISSDEWGVTEATRGQKAAHELLFAEDFEQLRERADALLVPKKFQQHIEIDPQVKSGEPTVGGTTIRSIVLYRLRQKGYKPRQIQREYPALTLRQVKAAIDFERFLEYEAA